MTDPHGRLGPTEAIIYVPNGAPRDPHQFIPSLPGYSKIHRVINEYGGNEWFVFYIADCFDPPLFLVAGDSFEEAYDNFTCDSWVEENLEPDEHIWREFEQAFISGVRDGEHEHLVTLARLEELLWRRDNGNDSEAGEAAATIRALVGSYALENETGWDMNDNGVLIYTEQIQSTNYNPIAMPGSTS